MFRDVRVFWLALLGLVRFHVLREMVRAHEAFVTLFALEALFAGVRPQVSLEFIGAGETFAAEQPVADERSFAGVPPQVCLEMRSLSIDFTAARYVTDVLLTFCRGSAVGRVLTAGTPATSAPSRRGYRGLRSS